MRSSALTVACSFVLATLGLAACGDSSSTGTGGSGGKASTSATTTGKGTGTGTSTSTATGSGGGGSCDEPMGTASATLNVAVTSVQGTVKDTSGAPAASIPVQVCGKNTCLYGTTGAAGTVTVTNTGTNLDRPIFKVGDGLATARSAYPVATPTAMVLGTVLSMSDSAKPFTGGTTITVGNATLDLAAGTIAGFALEYSDASVQTLRIGEVPAGKLLEIAPGKDFKAIYGFGPIETVLCPPAKLTVKNDTGLAANAAVEFHFQELQIGEGFGTYGDWTQVSDGAVSADGMTISTNAGAGIPELGMIGIRAK